MTISLEVFATWLLTYRLSVPLVDSDSYDQQWFIAASVGFPTFMLWYSGLLTLSFTLPLALFVGAILGAISYSFTSPDRAPEWSLGLPFPVGAAIIACIGFVASAMWIDTIAGSSSSLIQLATVAPVSSFHDCLGRLWSNP